MSRVRDIQKVQAERFRSLLGKLDAMPATNIDLKDAMRAKIRAAVAALPDIPIPPEAIVIAPSDLFDP